jgi:ssDNA-binding Zn-finger/Zn-ribbon topoisomerase 1
MTDDVKCPICGSQTTLRTVKKGPDTGKQFQVCNRYPDCKGRVAMMELHIHCKGKTIVDTKTAQNKKPILHDGYYVRNGEVSFYSNSADNKAIRVKHPKVNGDIVIHWEGLCETYRKNFEEVGWLRLHTPTRPEYFAKMPDTLSLFKEMSQEQLGGHFLSVPPQHRLRIAEMLNGGTLVMLDRLKTFLIVESGKQITFQQLVGDGELFDFLGTADQNHRDLESGKITKEEWEKRVRIVSQWEKTRFHVDYLKVDMFVQE